MIFKEFENGRNFLEYLQIFCFYELIVKAKLLDKVSILAYHQFELTDKITQKYNLWINEGCPKKSSIETWFNINRKKVVEFKSNFGTVYKPKVSIWSDRKKTTYYKEKLQNAFIFENYIAEILQEKFNLEIGSYLTPEGQYNLGENALGIEIKNDTLISKYGNIYIEYQEKSKAGNNPYINSGILKNDNCKYFLLGTEKQFFIFRKSRLVEIYNEEKEFQKNKIKSKRGIKFKQKPTSRGFVFPVKNAQKETISIEELVLELKNRS